MMDNDVASNLTRIRERIAQYEEKYEREKEAVQLLAVSKGHTEHQIEQAYHAGQRCFAENYLQEALPKITALSAKELAIEWHFIGKPQSNKTRKIAEHFAWVHSVDSLHTAKRLNDQRPSHLPPLQICLEVNISHADSKSGLQDKHEVAALAQACAELPHITLRGLMTIPTHYENFDGQRREFRKLFTIWEWLRKNGYQLDTLSMGMSGDFEAAIAEGATVIRIGTAIFGPRTSHIIP